MVEEKTIFQKIGDAIADYAPGIAGTLLTVTGGTGAIPAAVIGGLGMLAKSFGLGDNAKPEDILQAVTTDPNIALKARMADQDFELRKRDQDLQAMKEDTERLRIQLNDVQSARLRQMEIETKTGRTDKNLYVLAYIGVLLPFILVWYFIQFGLPKMTPESALMIGGFVGLILAKYGSIYDYFFGSSKGSADKSMELAGTKK